MNSVTEKKNILKIDYTNPSFREKYTSNKYKRSFDWVSYKIHYPDLSVRNLNEAWNHWCSNGLQEKRFFFILNNQSNETLYNKIKKMKQLNDIPATKSILKSDVKRSDTIQLSKNTYNNKKMNEEGSNNIINIEEPIPIELGSRELGSREVGSREVGSREVGSRELGSREVESTEEKATEVGITAKEAVVTKTQSRLNDEHERTKQLLVKMKNIVKRASKIQYEQVEEERSKIKLFNIKNLIFKDIYSDYGLQLFGWSGVLQSFTEFINNEDRQDSLEFNSDTQYLFDEWIEKLLIWGNKYDNTHILNEIKKNNYKIITFLHNPPFSNWYNNVYRANIKNKIIYENESTNKNIFDQIESRKLKDHISYIYTLSNSHKEYIYNKCPEYRDKIMSVLHPIPIFQSKTSFDINIFTQTKQILHIGWSHKNFSKFITFYQPKEFTKTILIKKSFEIEWNRLSSNMNLTNINILKELKAEEYQKLFTCSCLFVFFEDCSASNVILECIKFNTPVIINKIPAVIEYLGPDYPLYYEKDEDLQSFKNPKFLNTQVDIATKYLKKMNKTHIDLDTFNEKIYYDLSKLSVNIDNYKLTWVCPIADLTDIFRKIQNLYNNFISQNNNKQVLLKILIEETLYDNDSYDDFIKKLEMYEELVHNISFEIVSIKTLYQFYNDSFNNCETQFITFVNINDQFDNNFSVKNIEYLSSIKNCDICFSSYNINLENRYKEEFLFKKNTMLFSSNISSYLLPLSGVVYRSRIIDILKTFSDLSTKYIFRDFHRRALERHLNIMCCSEELLLTADY